jgi:hypothetical protein
MKKAKSAPIPNEWIDELPLRPSPFKARVVSIATIMLVGLGVGAWWYGGPALAVLLSRNYEASVVLFDTGLQIPLIMCFRVFGVIGIVCLVAGLASLIRISLTYRLIRASLLLVYPVVLVYSILVWMSIFAVVNRGVPIDGSKYKQAHALVLWWGMSWPALAVGLYTFWLHVLLSSRSVAAAFTGVEGQAMRGDTVLEDWRTHGPDPRARRSLYASIVTHILVIIVIPFLLSLRGCVEPFSVPKGSGVEAVASFKPKIKKKKPKKKKKLLLARNRAIIWHEPDLFEETEVDKVMEQETQLTYSANGQPGKIGKGGGKQGGWPEGMEGALVRFPRLNHGGPKWDDGMNHTRADVNFLWEFRKVTGFKTASRGEALTVAELRSLPEDGFPPFLYITGNGSVGNLSNEDCKALREYCLNGGMIIGDAGSHTFNASFRRLLGRIFKDKRLIDISDDDVIYQQPFRFPDGAPSFWHHGGRRALGIKHEGQWVVFYHPGDMNDAWKSRGYSDVTPEMRHNAMKLGINLVAYAFNRWNDAVAKLRK